MRKSVMIGWGVGIVVLVVIFMVGFGGDEDVSVESASDTARVAIDITPQIPPSPILIAPRIVNFEQYNYDYVDENVKSILNSMLGPNGKTAFYLPSVGYVNVSRGSKYGVAYALNNPNPSGVGINWEQYNSFEFDWTVDPSVVGNCGVSVVEAQKWIERGWSSWGEIAQGWIDHMTVYFSFPADIEACSVAYNFVITKDGVLYDSRSVLFNLV